MYFHDFLNGLQLIHLRMMNDMFFFLTEKGDNKYLSN